MGAASVAAGTWRWLQLLPPITPQACKHMRHHAPPSSGGAGLAAAEGLAQGRRLAGALASSVLLHLHPKLPTAPQPEAFHACRVPLSARPPPPPLPLPAALPQATTRPMVTPWPPRLRPTRWCAP